MVGASLRPSFLARATLVPIVRVRGWENVTRATSPSGRMDRRARHCAGGTEPVAVVEAALAATDPSDAPLLAEEWSSAVDMDWVSAEEKRALASDPTTDPETLAVLAESWAALRPLVVANPSTPSEVRARLLAEWPHLRQAVPTPEDEVERAYANLRAASPLPRPARPSAPTAATGYVEMVDVDGRRVRVPAAAVAARSSTNGFAIASLVTGLLGLSLFAVIFGHAGSNQIRRTGEGGAGMAAAGMILGYLGIVVALIVIVVAR